MGDLFLDIDNTIFHVLLKQGVGKKVFWRGHFHHHFTVLSVQFFLVFWFFFFFWLLLFFWGGVGFVGFTENFNYL